MLTRLIVASYVWLLEVALCLTLTIAAVVGYHAAVPMMSSTGLILANEFLWKICGAFLFPVFTFLVLAVITGPFLVVVDIRQMVRRIEARLDRGKDINASPPLDYREPTF